MLKVAVSNLSGGQGKTTVALLLSRLLSQMGCRVLAIDSDPQHSLTDYMGVSLEPESPTLLEVFKGLDPNKAIVRVTDNLDLIPADDALVEAQEVLGRRPIPMVGLQKALEGVKDYDIAIVDTPTRCLHLPVNAITYADLVVIPAECASKGVAAIGETLAMIQELAQYHAFTGEVLGVVPFRAKWVGLNPTYTTRESLEAFQKIAAQIQIPVWPLIPESDIYKRAIDQSGKLPRDLKPESMVALEQIAEKIVGRLT